MLAALSAVFLGAIDLSIIATILPSIVSELNINTADIDRYIWIVNAYLIAYIAAIPLAGRISDLVGRRRVFLACLGIFLIGSVLCATSSSLENLILARAVQGFGGGGLLPVTIALAGDLFSRKQQLGVIGTIASVETLGWIVGPSYGAVITTLSGNASEAWRWVFWLNVPIGIAVIWFTRHHIAKADETGSSHRLRQLDIPGALLLTGAIVFASLGLTSSGEIFGTTNGLRAFGGTPNPLADQLPVLGAVAIVCLAGFWFRQRSASSPILPSEMLGDRRFVAAIVANFLIGTVMMIGIVNVPVVVTLLISGGDVSWTSALLLAPLTVGIAVAAALGGKLGERVSASTIVLAGTILSACGMLSLYPLLEALNVWLMIPGLTIAGLGIGLLLPPLSSISLNLATDQHRGVASSTLIMVRLLGMTIGISGLSAVGVFRLQRLTDRLEPITQSSGESTALFLARQQEFLIERAIPLAVQVLQETFAIAAVLALLATIPLLRMQKSGSA